MEEKKFIRLYKEGKRYYVVYGDVDSFFGPSEQVFDSKREATDFIAKNLIVE